MHDIKITISKKLIIATALCLFAAIFWFWFFSLEARYQRAIDWAITQAGTEQEKTAIQGWRYSKYILSEEKQEFIALTAEARKAKKILERLEREGGTSGVAE